jgi:hypothetical protein
MFDELTPIHYLPALSYPKVDELLSSFLFRLAHDHYLKAHSFGKIIFPKTSIWNRDIDRSAHPELLEILSTKINMDKAKIANCLLSSFEGKVFVHHNPKGSSKWIVPFGIFHRARKRRGLMFCPNCLSMDGANPYYRKSWRLSLSTVCAKCESLLNESCPSCESPIIFFRNDLGDRNLGPENPIYNCFHCGYDLRSSKLKYVTRRFVRMQKYFNSMIDGTNKKFQYPTQYFDVLYQICKIINGRSDKSQQIRRILSKMHKIQFDETIGSQPFDFLGVNERLSVLFCSYWLLVDWPFRFINFCEMNEIWSSCLLKDFQDPPKWFYDTVVKNLFIPHAYRKIRLN